MLTKNIPWFSPKKKKKKTGGNILQFGSIIGVNQGKNFSNRVDRDILVEVRLAHQYRPLQTILIGRS